MNMKISGLDFRLAKSCRKVVQIINNFDTSDDLGHERASL